MSLRRLIYVIASDADDVAYYANTLLMQALSRHHLPSSDVRCISTWHTACNSVLGTITVFRFQAIKALFLSQETTKLMSLLGDV
jgi:hypothetical protein